MNRRERRLKRRQADPVGVKGGRAAVQMQELLSEAVQAQRSGDLDRSRSLVERVLKGDPDNPAANQILGVLLIQEGNPGRAIGHLERVAEVAPRSPEVHLNLGVAYENTGDLDRAVVQYKKTVSLNPRFAVGYSNLGNVLRRRGEDWQALESFNKALDIRADYPQAHQGYTSILRGLRTREYRPEIEAAVLWCLKSPLTNYGDLAPTAAAQLALKYDFPRLMAELDSAGAGAEQIAPLAGDELFMEFLKKCLNPNIDMEKLLTKLRRHLLLHRSRQAASASVAVRLAAAMALQCFMNEYVFFAADDERRKVARLRKRLERSLAEPERAKGVLADVAFYGMYAPLHSLSGCERLLSIPKPELGPDLDAIVQVTLRDHMEEQAIKREIKALGPIADPISRAVRDQYEENPYPRWLCVPKRVSTPLPMYLRDRFPHFPPPGFLGRRPHILVAGCGTGQHAMNVATRTQHADIVAIDLSKSSLAYAMRMARKHNVTNIRFLQADILNARLIGKVFDVVESVGVLHHMKEPIEGWRVLCDLLRPGGLMRIGLYSEKARRDVVDCRNIIKGAKYASSHEDIVSFRYAFIDDGAEAKFPGILERLDFYSTSMCRDLLFHVQENRFTLPQIRDILEDLHLRFIGFDFDDPSIAGLYKKHFPEDAAMTDLVVWDKLENMYPGAIQGYLFWCQKR